MSRCKEIELDDIPDDWRIEKFNVIAQLQHGYQFRNYDFTKTGIKVIKITQIKDDGQVDLSACSFIDEKRCHDFNKFIIKKGDILLALTGATIGKFARYEKDEIVLQNYRVGNFKPLDDQVLNKDYLYYFLSSKFFFHQIIARQTQSAQQNIGKDEINNMSIILPSIDEQKKIGQLLLNIDQKISLLRQQNETLENMAQTLYKHWFVDYEFPDENGNRYKSSGGKMVCSELGEIPEGWELLYIKDLSTYNKGFEPGSKAYNKNKDGVPFYRVKDINVNGQKAEISISSLYNQKYSDYLFDEQDILVSTDGTLGKVYVGGKGYHSSGIVKIRTEYKMFMYSVLKNRFFISYLIQNASGTTIKHAAKVFNVYKFVAKKNYIEQFEDICGHFFEQMIKNIDQIKTLTEVRDILLPKLMSGELRIIG